jgi:hypothetical protein
MRSSAHVNRIFLEYSGRVGGHCGPGHAGFDESDIEVRRRTFWGIDNFGGDNASVREMDLYRCHFTRNGSDHRCDVLPALEVAAYRAEVLDLRDEWITHGDAAESLLLAEPELDTVATTLRIGSHQFPGRPELLASGEELLGTHRIEVVLR